MSTFNFTARRAVKVHVKPLIMSGHYCVTVTYGDNHELMHRGEFTQVEAAKKLARRIHASTAIDTQYWEQIH